MSGQPEMRWTKIGEGKSPDKILCRCACGTEREVNKKNFKAGLTRSCGCLNKERLVRDGEKLGAIRTKHGKCGTPEHTAWAKMKHRCTKEGSDIYEDYGARGITVCARWQQFEAFLEDMGTRPTEDHSIDRIDNDKGYWCGKSECPECGPAGRIPNCRWATQLIQSRNSRRVRNITFEGRTQCLQAWADEYGLPANVLAGRLDLGWDTEKALSEPVKRNTLTPEQVSEIRRRYDKRSEKNGSVGLAKEFGVSYQTIQRILNHETQKYEDS